MAEIILNVDVRENVGTGGARAARRDGAVPGVLYGGDKAPVAISVNEREFRKSLYTGKLIGHLVTLKHGKESQPVIAKDIQFDPVTDRPLHFDLMRVGAKEEIKIEIPVAFVDLKGREIGENIRISDIHLPEGATPVITDRDFMIAAIKNSAAGQSDAGDTTAEGEAEEA
jgi:large subunit ribosomal protein L25